MALERLALVEARFSLTNSTSSSFEGFREGPATSVVARLLFDPPPNLDPVITISDMVTWASCQVVGLIDRHLFPPTKLL